MFKNVKYRRYKYSDSIVRESIIIHIKKKLTKKDRMNVTGFKNSFILAQNAIYILKDKPL